jgi:hypothetical protein
MCLSELINTWPFCAAKGRDLKADIKESTYKEDDRGKKTGEDSFLLLE